MFTKSKTWMKFEYEIKDFWDEYNGADGYGAESLEKRCFTLTKKLKILSELAENVGKSEKSVAKQLLDLCIVVTDCAYLRQIYMWEGLSTIDFVNNPEYLKQLERIKEENELTNFGGLISPKTILEDKIKLVQKNLTIESAENAQIRF